MPHLLLSPRRVVEREFENPGAAGGDKGKGPANEAGSSAIAVPAFPCPTLGLQMRPSKKASMSGGSSAHNVQKPVKVKRELSVYVPFSPPAEVDAETLFEQSELAALASPRKAFVVDALTCTLLKQQAPAVPRTPPRTRCPRRGWASAPFPRVWSGQGGGGGAGGAPMPLLASLKRMERRMMGERKKGRPLESNRSRKSASRTRLWAAAAHRGQMQKQEARKRTFE
jgi:hypothetical protein